MRPRRAAQDLSGVVGTILPAFSSRQSASPTSSFCEDVWSAVEKAHARKRIAKFDLNGLLPDQQLPDTDVSFVAPPRLLFCDMYPTERVGRWNFTTGLSQVGSRTGAPSRRKCSASGHVSSPLHVARSVRISRTARPHLLRPKAYVTYHAGTAFDPPYRTL